MNTSRDLKIIYSMIGSLVLIFMPYFCKISTEIFRHITDMHIITIPFYAISLVLSFIGFNFIAILAIKLILRNIKLKINNI